MANKGNHIKKRSNNVISASLSDKGTPINI